MSTVLPLTHWIAWPLRPQAHCGPGRGGGSDAGGTDPGLGEQQAWWALRWSPRVTVWGEGAQAVALMEVGGVERLWGGRQAMLLAFQQALREQQGARGLNAGPDIGPDIRPDLPISAGAGTLQWARAATAWQALARLRWRMARCAHEGHRRWPAADALPIWTLPALQPHEGALERMGCRVWGDLRRLPRAGLARRIGLPALLALDQAYGLSSQAFDWLELPAHFGLRADLHYPAHDAPAVLQAVQPLLRALQAWLQGRHQGVLALQLRWHHDLRRVDGVQLPPWAGLEVRTARPAQALAHIERLLRERLVRSPWRAPVDMLELNALETAAFAAEAASCLPPSAPGQAQASGQPAQGDDSGMAWHEWVERVSARRGAQGVQVVRLHADHRPEAMQRWAPACEALQAGRGPQFRPRQAGRAGPAAGCVDDPWQALWPHWLLDPPQPLALQGSRPCWQGPLQLLAGPYRLEAGWWGDGQDDGAGASPLAVRDYFVACNGAVGHVWIYRERAPAPAGLPSMLATPAWFAQGIYG